MVFSFSPSGHFQEQITCFSNYSVGLGSLDICLFLGYKVAKSTMKSQQRRKQLLPFKFLVLCSCSLFVITMFVTSHPFSLPSSKLRPALAYPADVSTLKSAVNLEEDFDFEKFNTVRVGHRVLFPDHVMLLVSSASNLQEARHCVYRPLVNDTIDIQQKEIVIKPVISRDEYDEFRSIIRCPRPPLDHSAEVELWKNEIETVEDEYDSDHNQSVLSSEMIAYEAVLDGETVIVFVKGLNLRQGRVSDPAHFSCHFGLGALDHNQTFVLTTKAISAAQEVVRCALPLSLKSSLDKMQGVRVSIGVDQIYHGRILNHTVLPSVAVISRSGKRRTQVKAKYEMCVCTMVWNQAFALREWIMYHSWLGVERWFIYDNNSDDETKEVIAELEENEYHLSRHAWPWFKSQEAGFSHCAIRAKEECNWVGFFDVDEFYYFPVQRHRRRGINGLHVLGKNSLRNMVASYSSSKTIGELRTSCHSFGPSGLRIPPSRGITTGYTCRLQSPERHKSIVRLEALHNSLLNVVHHFHLQKGFSYQNVLQSKSLINHYKYQAWDVFRAKFHRRVATYVADWQDNQNEGSRDRAPGLGTEAIQPPNWHLKFCEVWDTGLRDLVLANLRNPMTRELPWEKKHV